MPPVRGAATAAPAAASGTSMQSSYREVLRCLLEGLQWLLGPAVALKVAGTIRGSLRRARVWAGSRCAACMTRWSSPLPLPRPKAPGTVTGAWSASMAAAWMWPTRRPTKPPSGAPLPAAGAVPTRSCASSRWSKMAPMCQRQLVLRLRALEHPDCALELLLTLGERAIPAGGQHRLAEASLSRSDENGHCAGLRDLDSAHQHGSRLLEAAGTQVGVAETDVRPGLGPCRAGRAAKLGDRLQQLDSRLRRTQRLYRTAIHLRPTRSPGVGAFSKLRRAHRTACSTDSLCV